MDNDEPPPLSALLARVRFWWRVVRWPLVVVAMNIIVVLSLVVRDEGEMKYYVGGMNSSHRNLILVAMRRSVFVLVLLCATDAYILWRAVRLVEQENEQLQSRLDSGVESSSSASPAAAQSEQEDTFLYARLSKRVDRFLVHSPTTMSLVNVLYAMMVAMVVIGVVASFYFMYLLNDEVSQCILGDAEDSQEEARNLAGVPAELQNWVSDDSDGTLVVDNKLVYKVKPYSFMSDDGAVWFSGPDPNMTTTGRNYFNPYQERRGSMSLRDTGYSLLRYSSGSSTLETFPDVESPTYFMESANGSSDTTTAYFCCLSTSGPSGRNFDSSLLSDRTVTCCQSQGSSCRKVAFLPSHMKMDNFFQLQAAPWNGLIWTRAIEYRDRGRRFITVASVDPKTMEVEHVHSSYTGPDNFILLSSKRQACLKWLVWGLVLPGSAALVASSYWLLRIRDVPVGISPLVVASYAVLSSIDLDLGYYTGLLASLIAAVSLFTSLPAWLTRDMSWDSTLFLRCWPYLWTTTAVLFHL